jgi:hypothetical protein
MCVSSIISTESNLATYTTIDTDGVIKSTPYNEVNHAQIAAMTPSRIAYKQRKRVVLRHRAVKAPIEFAPAEPELARATYAERIRRRLNAFRAQAQ